MSSTDNVNLLKVQNSLSGYVSANNILKYYQNANVVVRRDYESMKPNIVRIITGGGSGHEPAHYGYIGEGMLTATVCGEIFASPSVTNILSAILSVARQENPILLIVTNYTGDRLNFGLAGEIAKAKYGYDVETVLVDDDCAIENVRKSVGKRGLAGTVLIHKIAGAMAAKGTALKDIHAYCSDILKNERLATVGFTFTTAGDRIKSIEIGKGVHGEPGIQKLDDEPDFGCIIEILVRKLLRNLPYQETKSKVLVMFNNLGGTSAFTMATFSNFFLQRIRSELDIDMVLEGTFMTSLNAEGISVTLLHFLDEHRDELMEYIKYTVKISANVPFNVSRSYDAPGDCIHDNLVHANPFDKVSLDPRFYRIKCEGFWKTACVRSVVCAAERVLQQRARLNELDKEFGDGDTGELASSGARNIHLAILKGQVDLIHPAVMFHDLSAVLQEHMGGSLGALFSIFLQAASCEAINSEKHDLAFYISAIKLGMDAVQKYGLAEIGDRTMLDALHCGVEEMTLKIDENHFEALEAFATGCEKGANQTKSMRPLSGRASYAFSDGQPFEAKENDPGAQIIALLARGVYDGLVAAFKQGY